MTTSSKLVYSGCRFCFRAFIVLISLLDFGLCEEFSNSWAVEIRGGLHVADHLAEKHGFINKGLVRKTTVEFTCPSSFHSLL